ncbi:hypothetical protein F1D05_14780 [Kribbella qitaiheensis]|uniref:Uncharacterized protein n=1 Tax=Kribbella qitaiheensis TaxID=1544730 RepID=A0A7G6WY79_9ACTN|nr:hypothetical protein [Kribbella qitaiheensis]QNE18944.1 hypothetical protein F1D05_14780 [Kribbella qitaiheensis]
MGDRFDLDAIEADDALLDLLAAGGETAWAAAEHDPALMVLAELRLAVEVMDELPVETIDDPESFLARCAALHPVNDPFARKMAARGLALGVVAVAALSVSGVAAAVTGDPLSPYEKVIEKVVEGLRPETTVPKEKLDGMTIFDKSKIVRVQKDYQKKQEEQQAVKDAEQKDNPFIAGPSDLTGLPTPPLDRPYPLQVEKPTTTKDPVQPPVVEPTQPSDPSEQPTGDPTGEPTDTTPTPPPTEPTDTTSPTPSPIDPPTSGPTQPAGEGDNGTTGDPVTEPSAAPTTIPTTVPGESTGETGTGQTETGDTGQTSTPGGATDTTPAGSDLPSGDLSVGPTLSELLPTPTGEPTELPTRLEQYFGGSQDTSAKHSSGKVALGYAKGKYQVGKHSNGKYVEGRHAAIARAHGSMAGMTLRQILTVLNVPMNGR